MNDDSYMVEVCSISNDDILLITLSRNHGWILNKYPFKCFRSLLVAYFGDLKNFLLWFFPQFQEFLT